ncbi:MAG: 4Fe-4S binding protein [Planctomycetes bacterium]|nr:4Fe-4S binding protein [Planctomycetota bacterium]
MIRKIVNIDEDKCDGCGLCVPSCAEGAIQIIDGKARLVSDVYCDGLGACLGDCPNDAITIEEREAPSFDEAAAQEHVKRHQAENEHELPCGCPGSAAGTIERKQAPAAQPAAPAQSQLSHWPVQLKLVPPTAPYFQEADLLLVADCVPFALADFHTQFLRGKPIVIGCPKLDDASFYVEKLAGILRESSVKSLTVVHMEVPCCHGLTRIAGAAIDASGAAIPFTDVTISISGEVLGQTCPQT